MTSIPFEKSSLVVQVARQAAEKVLLLLTKYGKEELSIVLESVIELKDKLTRSKRKLRDTQLSA